MNEISALIISVLAGVAALFAIVVFGSGMIYLLFGLLTWISTWPWELVKPN